MPGKVVTMEEGVKNTFSASAVRPTSQVRVPTSIKFLKIFFLLVVLCLVLSLISIHMFKYFGVLNFAPLVASSSFTPCFQEPTSLNSFITPSNVLHDMNDSELLWRASLEPRIKKYPFKRVPKVAFMFLTKGPLPLSPLWERFFKGHEGYYSIYVHALPNYFDDFSRFSAFYGRQIPSKSVFWGEMSMCDAERRLLANALLDISNEWFILVSESCIPLHNFSIIYRYISRSRHSFVGSYDDPGPFGRGRYHHGMKPEVSLSQWRKGSQWFEVTRKLAIEIIQDTTYYPKFRDYCKPACYVDEHYFPTMLTIEFPHLLANRSLTWTDWSRGGAHPATFGRADITEELLTKLMKDRLCLYNGQQSTVCYLFARKFAPSALEPLLSTASKSFGF